MELSRQADYAVRAMVDLAAASQGTRVLTSEIAARQDIPQSFLPRIIALLGKAQLVQTFRGKDGGIALSRPAKEINLLEVIEAVEGPICLNLCTHQPSRCERSGFCRVHPIWQKANGYLAQLLETTTLADLADGSRDAVSMPIPVKTAVTL
jgi:Rrf2 family protein